jgi:hypothetical protein
MRPVPVVTPWGAELGSCTTCGRRRAALPPRFVTFDCGFFEALLLNFLGDSDTFCASLRALTLRYKYV